MDDLLQRFIEQAPVAVMVRATLARALSDTTLNTLFERNATVQYTRELTFSSLVKLMARVAFGTHKSVHAAYRHTEDIPVSITAVYDKLQNVEGSVLQALVRETGQAMRGIIQALPGVKQPTIIKGLRLRTIDGNSLAGTDHRLECLRDSGAAALPGKSLVVRDAATGLLTDLIPCEDAYTNERVLYPQVLPLVEAGDLWLADRNFCTLDYLGGFADREACFLVRHHAGTHLELVGEERPVGSNPSGDVFEQSVRVGRLACRCIRVKLFKPLPDGTTEIRLLTNVPAAKAGAKRLAELYRTRWQIETAFQVLTQKLHCEVQTLGYPQAALFAFALAVVAYNVLAVVECAVATDQSKDCATEELSRHHLATEVAVNASGMAIALPEATWRRFAAMPLPEFAKWLHQVAQRLDRNRYRKNKRGPKKQRSIQRTRRGAHRSTARVLQAHRPSP
jgi:hypothetical protein